MAKRIKKGRKLKRAAAASSTRKKRLARKSQRNSRPKRQRRRKLISDVRLERALRVYGRTKDIATAARAIGVSQDTLKRAALRKVMRRKRRGGLGFVRRLPRRMPIFSGGKQLAITVRSSSASQIGRYMSAVRQFLHTNDPKVLAEFEGRGVKDVRGKVHQFETDPNVLYRLSSAGNEPFEDIYRIVI